MDRTQTMRAAIFDMDGTLIDSMSSWRRLNADYIRSQNIPLTDEQEAELFSLSGMQVIPYYMKRFGVNIDFETLCSMACQRMESVYAAGLPLKPGAAQYLDRLRARGVKLVLATATPPRQALIALNRMGLVSKLDYIYSTEMIGPSKNQPEFFDKLCKLIGERKEDCVMFEDSLYAMRGAREAGLGVIGITDSTNLRDREDILKACDRLIDSYDELP